MKRMLFSAALVAAVGLGTVAAVSQNADPYANNAAAGTLKFPLAAPAGVDSKAMERSLPGAVNTGSFDDKKWKYGTAFNPPPGAKIWNPVKLKMMKGEKVTVYLNDVLVVDNVVLENYWDRAKPIYDSGQIELQNHGNPLSFRNVFVREIPRGE